MSNYAYKAVVGRASSVLTTSEVAGATCRLDDCHTGRVTVQIAFTLGMLTNVTLRPYVSMDGSTWVQLANPAASAGTVLAQVPTANYAAVHAYDCAGWKYFRMSAQGSGTVTNSLLALTYRFLKVGSQ